MNASKRSCFAWTIYSTTELWTGSGAVPGHYEDSHLTRSEAFEILMMLRFLLNYVSCIPLVLWTAHLILLYCNNNGILQHLNPKPHKVNPKSRILDDYNIVAKIQQTIHELRPLKIKLHHIKGHQDDKTATQDLTIPAKLNIECYSQANEQLPHLQQHSIFLPHPMLPSAYPYLMTHDKIVIRELTDTLRQAATTPDYKEYMEKKHDWTSADSYEVNWNALKLAMKHVKPKDCRHLQKYLHDWLSYWALHRQGNILHDLTLCPSCQQAPENQWHFLECTNPKREQLYQSLIKDLQTMHMKQNLDMELYYLLQASLHGIHTGNPIPEAEEHFPNLKELHLQQSRIGWDQLFYGRISITWAHHIDHISAGHTNRTIFYS